MVRSCKGKNRRYGSSLLTFLFGLGLACLGLAEAAEGGVYPAWIRQYAVGDSSWRPVSMAVDGQGNVYVTGNSEGSETGCDYLTIKYSPKGKRLWVRRYNGPENSYDYAKAMALDSQGNVYVTGSSSRSETGVDYVTVKYSPDGHRLWVRRYNGPENSYDKARAMALDSQGNLYITGQSAGAYATIKYSPDGRRLWVRRYQGSEGRADYATAIAVDGQDHVYVTGSSWGSENNDFATIKYSPDGRVLWVARDSSPTGDIEDPCAIAVDAQGNVSITGGKWGVALTINYGLDGQRLWSQKDYLGNYGAPNALAKDSQGNVYVTGTVIRYDPGNGCQGCYSEYLTIKYGPDGQMIWWRSYGFPHASVQAMALDNRGNVYLTGYSGGSNTTIKYSPDGELLWEQRHTIENYGGTLNLVVDFQGQVYVSGCSGFSSTASVFFTIKYIQTSRTGR